MTKAKAERLVLDVPEQGIPKRKLTTEKAIEWVKEELRLWGAIGIPNDFQALNTRHQAHLQAEYDRYLQTLVKELEKGADLARWRQFNEEARGRRILILQGAIGEKVQELLKKAQPDRAMLIAVSFSESVHKGNDRSFLPLVRAAMVDHPAAVAAHDLHAVKTIRRETDKTSETVAHDSAKLDEMITSAKQRLADLEELYHAKLVMEGPSRHWKSVADTAGTGKIIAFIAFCVLLAIPALFAWVNWASVTSFLDHLIKQSNGGISLAAIAAITVPTLAYGWLLKHISRSYVQNLAIQTDARHRRVMTTTFLGLAKRKAVDLTEADRALILNALFRPAPPHTADDGPPSGLIDLIRK